jgi:hypothetical protein
MNNRACLLITAEMYTPVLLLTSSQQDGPAEKAGKNVDQPLEEAGKKIEKTGDAIKDRVENAGSSLDAASITMAI